MNIADRFGRLKIMPSTMEDMIRRFHTQLGPKVRWVQRQFGQLSTLEDKFTFIWNLPEAQQYLTPPPECEGIWTTQNLKVEDEAERFKTEGNIQYRQNNLGEALKLYNMSIMFAPHPKLPVTVSSDTGHGDEGNQNENSNIGNDMKAYKTLGCAYANRSAVFLAMKEYSMCLSDIDLALKYGYPELLKSKLKERREKCVNAQKQSGKSSTELDTVFMNAKKPPMLAKHNKTIPAFSNAVKLAYTPARGRHVIAVRDILPGELIAVEKSYCNWIPFPKKALHCCECLMASISPVPCPECCVPFCSETCRTKGLKKHGKECNVLFPAMVELDLACFPYACMAFKILLNTPFVELREKLPLLEKEAKELPPLKLGFNEKGIYSSADYTSVYHAVAALSISSERDVYGICLFAFVLTKVLSQEGKFFTNSLGLPINPTSQDFIMTGRALVHHMYYSRSQFMLSDTEIRSPSEPYSTGVGDGLFPSIILMKHSCNASAVHYNIGSVKIVKSYMLIPAGNEVTLPYCEGYSKSPKSIRKMELKDYGITCSCEACEDDWPTADKLPKEITVKCVKCFNPVVCSPHPTCFTCNINYGKENYKGEKKSLVAKWMDLADQVRSAEERFKFSAMKITTNQSVSNEDFSAVCKFVHLMQKHVQLPCQPFCQAREIMLMYYIRG